MMMAVLDWIYGPNGQTDPYYLLMQDFLVLMPWWYGYFWMAVIVGFFGIRRLRKALRNRKAGRRATQIQQRTRRIMKIEKTKQAIRMAHRAPSNDNLDPLSDAVLAS